MTSRGSNVVRATLIADDKRFKSGFKSAEKTTESFQKKVSGTGAMVKGVLAGAAAAAVINFSKDAVRAFSEVEQATGSVESVFGSAAGKIINNSKAAATQFGLSADEFMSSSALLGSQLQNTLGLGADEAAVKVQELIGRASDMAATFGGTTADAVAAIGSLMRGERDPIEKYGVSMNEAAIAARAMEMGLADANGQLSPQAKGLAALDILYGQTENSAGQFGREQDTLAGKTQILNAQIENNKALVGQALQGTWKNIGIPIVGEFHEALGNVAIAWMELTGEMTEAEAMMARMDLDTTTSGLDQMRAVLEETNFQWGRAGQDPQKFYDVLLGGLSVLQLTKDDLQWFLTNLPVYAETIGLTAEEEEAARKVAEVRLETLEQEALDLQRGRGREEEYAAALDGTADAQKNAADQTYGHIDAIQKLADKIRAQTDPMFAYQEAFYDLEEAERATIDAAKEYGEGSPEHIDALNRQRDAAYDYKDAQLALAEQGGLTRSQLETHLRSLATFTEEQIDIILADFDRINAFQFAAKTIRITHEVTGGGPQEYHEGGVVPGPPGTEVPIVAMAGETILPTHKGGGSRPLAKAGEGGNIYITVNSLDPQGAAKAVMQAIESYRRNNGGFPTWWS